MDAIRTKHALREYDGRPVPEADIRAIVNAGRRAQSWYNKQTWRFIVVQDAEMKQKLATAGRSTKHAAGAAFVLVLCIPQENELTLWNYFDLGQAAAYLQLAAHSLGVGSSLGTIYEPEQVREWLDIDPDWWSPILLSMGYPKMAWPREPKAEGRLSPDEVVHWGRW
jgi:nitroreductase